MTRKQKPDTFDVVKEIQVAYTVPWRAKDFVKKIQKTARTQEGIKLKASSEGLYVSGEHKVLGRLGLAEKSVDDASLQDTMRIARSKTKILAGVWFRHPSGELTGELYTSLKSREAKVLADDLAKSEPYSQVIVYDNRGWPFKAIHRK